jgi:hypothetical protein
MGLFPGDHRNWVLQHWQLLPREHVPGSPDVLQARTGPTGKNKYSKLAVYYLKQTLRTAITQPGGS